MNSVCEENTTWSVECQSVQVGWKDFDLQLASVDDIDSLSTLTLTSDKFTYTPSNEQTSSVTGTFQDESSNSQATFDSDVTGYTLSADSDQVTFNSSKSITGLGNQTTVTLVRKNSSEYKQIKSKIEAQAESSSSSSTAGSSSSTTASKAKDKISSAVSGIKDKIESNSSSSEESSSDFPNESSSSESTTSDGETSDGTSFLDQIKNQIQGWLSEVGN